MTIKKNRKIGSLIFVCFPVTRQQEFEVRMKGEIKVHIPERPFDINPPAGSIKRGEYHQNREGSPVFSQLSRGPGKHLLYSTLRRDKRPGTDKTYFPPNPISQTAYFLKTGFKTDIYPTRKSRSTSYAPELGFTSIPGYGKEHMGSWYYSCSEGAKGAAGQARIPGEMGKHDFHGRAAAPGPFERKINYSKKSAIDFADNVTYMPANIWQNIKLGGGTYGELIKRGGVEGASLHGLTGVPLFPSNISPMMRVRMLAGKRERSYWRLSFVLKTEGAHGR